MNESKQDHNLVQESLQFLFCGFLKQHPPE